MKKQFLKRLWKTLCWFIGVYVAIFGLTWGRYTFELDRLQKRVEIIDKKESFSQIASIQRIKIPVRPYLFSPRSLYCSWRCDGEPDDGVVQNLINVVESHKKDLSNVVLKNANLRGSDLRGSDLRGSDLRGSDLREADLSKAILDREATVDKQRNLDNMTGQCKDDLPNAAICVPSKGIKTLEVTNLNNANLRDATLCRVDMRNTRLFKADLHRANLYGALLDNATMEESTLINANLKYATLCNANLTGANLTGANLTGANLTGANLTGANLTGANLTGANLTGANLTGANLKYAKLKGADLREVKNLEQEQINQACVNDTTKLPANRKKPVPVPECMKLWGGDFYNTHERISQR